MSAILLVTVFIASVCAITWRGSVPAPPSLSVMFLGYTNRIGPFAIFAITNLSRSAITLDPTCLVNYSPQQGTNLHRITSVEGHKLRVTRLLPNEGFVEEVFVFPGNEGEWQFHCSAANSSALLKSKSSMERWLRQYVKGLHHSRNSKVWTYFDTEWHPYPP